MIKIISILIAAYNEENSIEGTLNNLLNQIYPYEYEIIVCVEGDDNTYTIVKKYQQIYPDIIKIIRNADDPKLQLIKKFKFTQNQVNAILDMRLRNLRKLEEKEIKQEYNDLLSEKNFLTKLLSSKSLQKKEIDNEIDFLIKKFIHIFS